MEGLKLVWEAKGVLLTSLGYSLVIAIGAVAIGFFIGVFLALIKIAPKYNPFVKIIDKIATLYIVVIRGTPMLVQLLIMTNVILVSFKYLNNNLIVPILALGINSGAYMAEIIRSGINSIDVGQMEAGRSLGLTWVETMVKIVIPQAIKVVVPAIFNEIIILVKDTSIVSYIALTVGGKQVRELLGMSEKLGLANPGHYMVYIFAAALLYLVVVIILSMIQRLIERGFKKHG